MGTRIWSFILAVVLALVVVASTGSAGASGRTRIVAVGATSVVLRYQSPPSGGRSRIRPITVTAVATIEALTSGLNGQAMRVVSNKGLIVCNDPGNASYGLRFRFQHRSALRLVVHCGYAFRAHTFDRVPIRMPFIYRLAELTSIFH